MKQQPLFFSLLLMMAVGWACTWSAPATPAPTSTPQIFFTPTPALPPPTSTPLPFFKENFDGNVDAWLPFFTKGKLNQATLSVQGGFYVFDLPQPDVSVYALYQAQEYTNTRVDVTVENRGYNKNFVSILCRYNDKLGWYEASVGGNGLFSIYYAQWNKKHTAASYHLLSSGGSTAIRQGHATNSYTFICREKNLLLGINGVVAAQLNEQEYGLTKGNLGIGVSSYNIVPIQIAFDTLEVSEP